ncbi:UNVERIFIED_CONTAM: hypothetical protein K2H54_018347, partial [Gekko kuhli]
FHHHHPFVPYLEENPSLRLQKCPFLKHTACGLSLNIILIRAVLGSSEIFLFIIVVFCGAILMSLSFGPHYNMILGDHTFSYACFLYLLQSLGKSVDCNVL